MTQRFEAEALQQFRQHRESTDLLVVATACLGIATSGASTRMEQRDAVRTLLELKQVVMLKRLPREAIKERD